MRYFLIEPIEGLTSIERASLISEQLYDLSRPKGVRKSEDVTLRTFQVLENGTDAVLVGFDNEEIKVHGNSDTRILSALYPNITGKERAALIQYIKGNDKFPFKNIIPSNTNEVTYQYLIDNGFIQDDII